MKKQTLHLSVLLAAVLFFAHSGFSAAFAANLISAVYNEDSDKYYFFYSDNTYYRKNYGEKVSGWQFTSEQWGGIPGDELVSAVYNSDTGDYYFFDGEGYYRK